MAQVNDTLAAQPSPASSKRVADKDDLRRIWERATGTSNDGWAYNGDIGRHKVPIKTLPELVQQEIDRQPRLTIEPADLERLMAAADKEQARRDDRRKQERLTGFAATVGPRFASATLENYKASSPEQGKVVNALRGYAGSIKEHVPAGDGIVLFGNAGSGKTHLLVAMGKAAIEAGFSVEWRNGQDVFAAFRDAISSDRSESAIVRRLVKPDVLILDDVLPPGGTLTEYQSATLYRIVDARYRQCRPVWATMNVENGSEAERGMGVQVVDRLRHGALTLHCDWPSYRKVAT